MTTTKNLFRNPPIQRYIKGAAGTIYTLFDSELDRTFYEATGLLSLMYKKKEYIELITGFNIDDFFFNFGVHNQAILAMKPKQIDKIKIFTRLWKVVEEMSNEIKREYEFLLKKGYSRADSLNTASRRIKDYYKLRIKSLLKKWDDILI